MEFLTINDVAEISGLPKPTIYRMFHEMSDLIPHRRIGRKILFPEEAITKITEIRRLTKEEGLTYEMIRGEILVSSAAAKKAKNGAENVAITQFEPRFSETVSQSIAAGFEGLREDLRLLAAQIDRQNDLLSRYLGQNQLLEDVSPPVSKGEFELTKAEVDSQNVKETIGQLDSEEKGNSADRKTSTFRIKWSNFWAGKGWKVQ